MKISLPYPARGAIWTSILVLLAFAVYFSVRSAMADWSYLEGTADSVSAAVSQEPGNAGYHALLAEFDESSGGSPAPQLTAATALSPLSSLYLIRAALRAEVDSDYPTAERLLRRAAEVDHKFSPRWALLNFYFRRGSATGVWPQGFWPTVNSALEMSSPGDTDAVFRLAWEHSQDPEAILSRLPVERKIQEAYLRFLVGTSRMDPASKVALRLASAAEASGAGLLLDYTERALAVNAGSAVAVWNALIARKLVPYAPLRPDLGAILTNKNFAAAAAPRGFDWRITPVDGVFVSQADDDRGLSVHFDGSEPEDCVLVKQTMPVLPGREYRIGFTCSSSASSSSGASGNVMRGLRWDITSGGKMIAASAELDSAADGAPGVLVFKTGAETAVLALHYQRPLGTVRAEGTMVIRGLTDQIVK